MAFTLRSLSGGGPAPLLESYLITGGSGTLGQALTKRILELGISERVCILSRNEHAQAAMRERFGNDPRLRFFIGDVRSKERLLEAMNRIDVVIHAAALKRVEVCQYNWFEAIKTNILGSVNVAEAAEIAGVKKAILISSDKACLAQNAYGRQKSVAEDGFLFANETVGANGPHYAVCRYGNVFASNGSVAPRWFEQIMAGRHEIEVRDPECTRFFMRAADAVDLVLNTIHHMEGGELVIPGMMGTAELPAYRLGDLADVFSDHFGVEQRVTGLPDYEKVHESLLPGMSSDVARRMSKEELYWELAGLDMIQSRRKAA